MSAARLQPHRGDKVRRKFSFRGFLLRGLLLLVVLGGAGAVVLKQYGSEIVPPTVDAVRAVIGPEAMAWIEATVYGMAETWQQAKQNFAPEKPAAVPWTTAEDSGDGEIAGLPLDEPTAAVSVGGPGDASPLQPDTPTPTISPTLSPTNTPTPSATPTLTSSPTLTPRAKYSPTRTPKTKRSATPTGTPTIAPTETPTPTVMLPTAAPTLAVAEPTETPTSEPTATAAPEVVIPESPVVESPPEPTLETGPTATAAPTNTPGPTTTPAPTHTLIPAVAGAPESLQPFIQDDQLPGEGVWISDGLPVQPNTGKTVFWKTVLRPNPERPYAQVYMVSMDPKALKLHMVAGASEPVSETPVYRGTQINPADYGALVASFNGGWKSVHGNYGMMVDGVQIAPPSPNAATLALHADGRLELGPWTTVGKATDLVSYRQNCPMLIQDGVIRYDKHTTSTWGLSLLDEMYVWRSGLGMTADGRLIYIAGNPISAEELAWALQRAGAVNAMQLDINSAWVHWVIYDHNAEKNEIRARPLVSTMTVARDQYLKPVERDFFYLTWK